MCVPAPRLYQHHPLVTLAGAGAGVASPLGASMGVVGGLQGARGS